MGRDYYRVTQNWRVLMEPRDDNFYMTNISGKPIQFVVADNPMIPRAGFEHPFTVGGTIGQVNIPADSYIIAKCESIPEPDLDSDQPEQDLPPANPMDEGVITISSQKLNISAEIASEGDASNLYVTTDKMTDLIIEIMKIQNQIKDINDKRIAHKEEYLILLHEAQQEWIKSHITDATVMKHIIALRKRLFAAENLLLDTDMKMNDLLAVTEQLNSSTISTYENTISGLQMQIAPVVTQMANITQQLEVLGVQTRESASNIFLQFAALNNAITDMSAGRTVAEVEAQFQAILVNLPEEIRGPVIAIKKMLIELINLRDGMTEQEGTLENVVRKDEPLSITPTDKLINLISDPVSAPVNP